MTPPLLLTIDQIVLLEIAAVILTLLQWLLVPHLLAQRNKQPAATMAWLLAILLLPAVGALFYLLVGNERVHRRHVRLARQLSTELGPDLPGETLRLDGAIDLRSGMPELPAINAVPPTQGNAADILPDGTSFFPLLLEAIRSAQHHIHLEFYIWQQDRAGTMVRDALADAARRGVEIRIMLDEIGSLTTWRRFFRPVLDAGGHFTWFRTFAPLRGRFHLNLRNHRKLVVIDGIVAMTGGMNIGTEYWGATNGLPPYRDLQVRLRGPVVRQLAEVFAQDWHFATGERLTRTEFYPPACAEGTVGIQIVPGGPDNEVNEVQLSMLAIVGRAQESIRLMTPYFVPEPPLLIALQLAAMRGVDVQLLVPRKCDHWYLTQVTRSYYQDLLPHGIRIFEYRPRLLHAKAAVVDGRFTMLGSANLDVRSLKINFELNVLLCCPDCAAQTTQLFERNLVESSEISLREHSRRPVRQRVAEAVLRPFAPLL